MPLHRLTRTYSDINYHRMGTSNWNKFCLLLWKNFLLQWRHKTQFFVEIFIPVLFCTLLVLIRGLADSDPEPNSTIFQPVEIKTLNTLKYGGKGKFDLEFLIRILSFNGTGPQVKSWTLIYSPQNKIFDDLVNESAKLLQLTGFIGVANENLLVTEMVNRQGVAGIVFHHDQSISSLPKNLRYSLRFPSESRTSNTFNSLVFNWQTNLLFPKFQFPGPRNRGEDNGGVPAGYQQEGFLAVQNAIAESFLKILSNKNMPEIMIQRYPYPPYIYDVLLTGLETLFSLLVLLMFIYPAINTIKFIAREKEKQLKEVMKIMGLPNWLHWTGWFIRTMALLSISISIIVLLFKIRSFNAYGISIFPNSDWTALWFFLFVYCIVTTMFTFMMSVFFSQANIAAAVGGLAWFLSYSAYSFTIESYDYLTLAEKVVLCFLSNTAMAYGWQNILRLEARGEGLNWSNMWQPISVDDNLSIGVVIIMFLASSVLYLLIALYVEKIMPGDYGVPERWNFPFTKSFWCRHSIISDIDDEDEIKRKEEYFEQEPIGKHAGIRIKNLRKVFSKKKVAVEGLTLNMYDDQITVLLGHNGAGKTTTMSMLCGMFSPTSGTAIVNGKNIRTDIEGVRNSMGLCPQHNILFDELTVREHIVFYGRLKGLNNEAIEEEVTKYVKLIDLEDKKNAQASTLSGGMKRKLSVCVAFCGGSKIVLCDEPTSGMDPAARRALWDVLKAEKQGRTVLLSTHFMDEADILGDRIAIMAKGHLKCLGSPYFLKKKIGAGYHLICVKKSGCDAEKISSLLRKYIPYLTIENNVGTELSYLLPDIEASKFQEMFKELEEKADDLRVESYGVSLSSMEDVFMKVGSDNLTENLENGKLEMNGHQNGDGDFESNGFKSGNFVAEIPLLTGVTLVKNQIDAMFKKKFYQTLRSYKLMLLQLLMPLVYLIITIQSAKQRAIFQELLPLNITLNSYDGTITVLQIPADPNNTEMLISSYGNNFKDNNELKMTTDSISDYILELSKKMLVRVNSKYLVGATITGPTHMTAWFNNEAYHTAPLSVNLLHNTIIQAYLDKGYSIDVTNDPLPYTSESKLQQLQGGGSMGFQLAINLSFALAFVAAFYILAYIKERESKFKLVQFVSGVNAFTFWLTAFIWDMITFVVTMILLILTLLAYQEDGWSSAFELGNVFLILFSFGFCVLPVTYIASRFFTIPATGYTRMTLIYIFTGIALFFTVFIMSFPMYDLKDTADALTWIFLIFPHFALSHSLNNFNIMSTMKQVCDSKSSLCPNCPIDICTISPDCCDLNYLKWKEPGVGRDIVYFFATGTICFVFLLLIELKIISSLIYFVQSLWEKEKKLENDVTMDSNVMEEKARVQAMSKFEIDSHNLVLKSVTKFYGKHAAVKQMSVAVENTECFGLLGINGAGKTSTFKMLTGDVKISAGEAWVRGVSLKSNMKEVYKLIGYCPQFDAIIGELTARETMEIFGLLRGIPKNKLRTIIETLATELNFMQHIDKKTRNLSGGNKRKVSTAIAILGNPSVIYLDEPTTGMDPAAKRHLWNIICKIRESGKSIVLTSHSMDECEALCTRLAIMVNGEFKCLGSVQHLKNKFSKGFILIIKVKKPDEIANVLQNGSPNRSPSPLKLAMEPIKQFVAQNFPGSTLQEEFQGLSTYYIPTASMKWSTMFGVMEDAKRTYNIEDYSLSQTSLEQIFLSFTKHQVEDLRSGNRNMTTNLRDIPTT